MAKIFFLWPVKEIDFIYCFLIEESEIYQLLFTSSKNIDPSQSYRWSNISAYV